MPGKQIEGTYKREDGTYFSVKASDLWDQCERCGGYHPKGKYYCRDYKKAGRTWAEWFFGDYKRG